MFRQRGNSIKIIIALLQIFSTTLALAPSYPATYPKDVLKLARMRRVKDVLNHYGYPGEEYTIKTADGYILELQRIPKPGGRPILLMHGLRGSSITYIMMGPWSDLAYLLHDAGYDVWLGNTRGTRFGKKHISLKPSQAKFWNFSFHEIGLYDLSAQIDFVLQKTSYKQLNYVGHSQGAAIFYVLASLRPEYNRKVGLVHAIAPAIYMHHMRSPFRTMARYYLEDFQYPFQASVEDVNYSALCHSNSFMKQLCIDLFGRVFGPSEPGALNLTMTPVLLANYPETCSVRQIAHYYQIHINDVFAPLEYFFRNQHQIQPYSLAKVTTPSAIYYCGNDFIVDPADVKRLIAELPHVIDINFHEECSHLDPIISTTAHKIFYKHILEIEMKFRSKFARKLYA